MYCLEMKKLPKVYENTSGIHQKCSSYGERAKDLERELERNTSSAKDGLCPMRKKLNKVGWHPCRLRGNLNELRKETGHSRQKLAKREFKFQLPPSGYSTSRGLKGPGHPSPSSGSPERRRVKP